MARDRPRKQQKEASAEQPLVTGKINSFHWLLLLIVLKSCDFDLFQCVGWNSEIKMIYVAETKSFKYL